MKLSPAECGRLGGLATLRKHGVSFFSEIGRKGYVERLRHYNMIPVGTSSFAWVKRKAPLTDEQLEKYFGISLKGGTNATRD